MVIEFSSFPCRLIQYHPLYSSQVRETDVSTHAHYALHSRGRRGNCKSCLYAPLVLGRGEGTPVTPLWACGATRYGGSHPSNPSVRGADWPDHAEGTPAGFVVVSGEGLIEGYVREGPGVCLGDDQTEAEGDHRGMDALLWRIPHT